jgi:hypothetical protein
MDIICPPRYPALDIVIYNISDIAQPIDLTTPLNPTPPDYPAAVRYEFEHARPVVNVAGHGTPLHRRMAVDTGDLMAAHFQPRYYSTAYPPRCLNDASLTNILIIAPRLGGI